MNGLLRSLVLMALMITAALVAPMLRATTSLADQRPPIDLQTMVPRQFGEWRELTGGAIQVLDPERQATVDRLYSETLARTYVNDAGYRIMLSVAYGKDQSDALQVHKPEVCYPAQGFLLDNIQRVTLVFPERSILATRLETQLGQRREPVTYWIVLGDQVTRGGIDKKLKEMRYSLLENTMPDGMLVRVSSIDANTGRAHQMQTDFASALIDSIDLSVRSRFSGLNNLAGK